MSKGALLNAELFRKRTGLDEADLRLVSSSGIFSGFLLDDLRSLLRDSAVQEYPKNSMLFLQGDVARRFYIVLDGWIKVSLEAPDGHETILRVCGAGDSFAEAAIFETNGYPNSAFACVDVRVLGVPTASFKTHMFASRGLRERVLTTMSRKYRRLTHRVEELSSLSAAQRLAQYLSSLCRPGDEAVIVQLPLAKAVIAAMLGMQPETFSRSLCKLRSVGVRVNGDTVSIANVRQLLGLSKETTPNSVNRSSDLTSQDAIFARRG